MDIQLPLKGVQQPTSRFLAHVCCGQMATWITIPLGAEVGLGSGNLV